MSVNEKKPLKKVTRLTSAQLRDIEFRVTAGLNVLYDDYPFYYFFLKNIPKKFDFKLGYDGAVSMDPQSKRVKVLINPERTENHNVLDFVGLLQHESLHLCYEHLLDPKYRKKATAMNFNKSCDYIINDHVPEIVRRYDRIRANLKAARLEMSQVLNGEFSSKLTGHPDEFEKFFDELPHEEYKKVKPKLDAIFEKYRKIDPFTFACTKPAIEHMPEVKNLDFQKITSEELYNILFKKKDDKKKNAKGQPQKGKGKGEKGDGESEGDEDQQQMKVRVTVGEPQDDHESLEGQGDEPIEMDEYTKEEIKKAIKDAANEALETSKSLGKMPANLSKAIFEMTKSKTNYLQIVNSFASSVKDSDRIRTWTRVHRKYPNQTPGRRREYKPHLLMGCDSSGSMWSDKIHTLMGGEIKALKEVCDSLTLVVGDTQEAFRVDLKEKEFILDKFKLQGGGGTDLQFIFDVAKELNCDGIILHTDGYIPDFDDHGIQVMFFIYPGGREVKPEQYRNYYIEDCL